MQQRNGIIWFLIQEEEESASPHKKINIVFVLLDTSSAMMKLARRKNSVPQICPLLGCPVRLLDEEQV